MHSSASVSPFRLALFWLGIQAVWGALLGISLQSRTIEIAGSQHAVIAYGRLATAGALMAAIAQIAVGFWADARRRRGSRRVEFYLIGAFCGAGTLLWFYDARSFLSLTIAFIVLQAAMNVAIGPYQAIIPDFVARRRIGIASSWMAALQSAGNAIGALAASFINNGGALGASLGGLLLLTSAVTSAHARALPLLEAPAKAQLRLTRSFVDLFVSRALVYIGFYTMLGYLLFYVETTVGTVSLSEARRNTGILIVGFTIVGTLGAALAARPSDRMDKRLVATVGAAGFIVALALFIGSHAIVGIAVATLLAGIGWGVFLVADWAIACRVLPPGAMASAMGLWNLAIVLPQIIAPAITTVVLNVLGITGGARAPRLALGLALIETIAGIAWLWRLSRTAIGD